MIANHIHLTTIVHLDVFKFIGNSIARNFLLFGELASPMSWELMCGCVQNLDTYQIPIRALSIPGVSERGKQLKLELGVQVPLPSS